MTPIRCERPLEQRRTSGGKELRPVAPLAFGVRAFSALPRHFLRSWTTDEASSGTEDSSSQKVSPGWGSSYRHPPRAEMPSGPVLLPSTPPFPPLVLRCSSGRTAARPMIPPLHPLQMRPDAILLAHTLLCFQHGDFVVAGVAFYPSPIFGSSLRQDLRGDRILTVHVAEKIYAVFGASLQHLR